jgi:hypothetical protein
MSNTSPATSQVSNSVPPKSTTRIDALGTTTELAKVAATIGNAIPIPGVKEVLRGLVSCLEWVDVNTISENDLNDVDAVLSVAECHEEPPRC